MCLVPRFSAVNRVYVNKHTWVVGLRPTVQGNTKNAFIGYIKIILMAQRVKEIFAKVAVA